MMTKQEIWKSIFGFENIYEISNLGRVKSLKRKRLHLGKYPITKKEKILKQSISPYGYNLVNLYNDKIKKSYLVHQLVAIHFLNHSPNKMELVINHKNFIRDDNRVCNLEIVNQRENSNKKHLKSSSKYTGVGWHKSRKTWVSFIKKNGKDKHLGCFDNEYDAHLAYQKELKMIEQGILKLK